MARWMMISDSKYLEMGRKIGYPVIIKAAGGGGGRGMRVVHAEGSLLNSIQLTKSEAAAAFNNDTVYMEKFLGAPRHIEIQILADSHGKAIHLGERDCSMQRRHQKVVEEAPAPGITEEQRAKIGTRCAEACIRMGYEGAGTFEFLYEERRILFHRDEYPGTGRTPGDRDDNLGRYHQGADIHRLGQSITLISRRTYISRGTRLNAGSTPRTRETFLPSPGKITLYHAHQAAPVCVWIRISTMAIRCRRTTIR